MKRVRNLSICALVFSLLFVAVGTYISFHSDITHANPSQASLQNQIQLDKTGEATHGHPDLDPCDQGFCHLGHCAKLVFANAFIPKVLIENQNRYFLKAHSQQDLVLDGPYQPPKLS